ncbi:type II secretion system protein N [Sphingomonas paeninsulae]|nr:type II secretion system protein N [Sphingomonas paeninsulae]
MQLTLAAWRARMIPKMSRQFPYGWIEAVLTAILAIQCARLIWTAFAPLGPVGNWEAQSLRSYSNKADALKTFDPFFRMSAQSGNAVITSLPLKLYGVRLDEATGHGSAIIATPDGVQQSFAIGDEVMPGIRLKSVARDNVTIDRGGSAEQLFLDQSVPAPTAQPAFGANNGSSDRPVLDTGTPASQSDFIFTPRFEKGIITGFAVAPRRSIEPFHAAGFLPGDIVTQINGASFDSPQAAERAIAGLPSGAPIAVTVQRAGKTMAFILKSRP